jgi:hypothetical protein
MLAETPRSAAICFNRRCFLRRHALKMVAKSLRKLHSNPDFPFTGKFQHNGGVKESGKTAGERTASASHTKSRTGSSEDFHGPPGR